MYRLTYKQAGKVIDTDKKPRDGQGSRQTDTSTWIRRQERRERERWGEAGRQTYTQEDRWKGKETVSLAGRQAGRQAGRWLRKNDGHFDQETKVSFRGNN